MVETDHNNLVYIQKSVDGRVGRWRLALQEFDFVVTHISGAENKFADCLSRCVVAAVSDGPVVNDSDALDAEDEVEDVNLDRKELISKFHNSDLVGHLGIGATVKKLVVNGYKWSSMREDVVKFIHSCPICQKTRGNLLPDSLIERHVIEAFEPFQEISLDSIVNLPEDDDGNSAILVVIDNFTRFVEVFAVPDLSAKTAAKCLLQVIGRYGQVESIRSDRGGQFVSDIFSAMVSLMDSRQLLTIGYRPQANGLCERANAEVVRHLSVLVNARKIKHMWSVVLPMVQRIMNATIHSSTGVAPATLLFGLSLNLDRGILSAMPKSSEIDVPAYVQKMQRAQVELIRLSQLHVSKVMDGRLKNNPDSPHRFAIGSYVLVHRYGPKVDKFDFVWKGPYLVKV